MIRPTSLFLCFASGLLSGCSGDRFPIPSYSPDQAAKLALAEYDQNGDGYLDANELERCPALKKHLEYLDANGDGRLNAEEIAARLSMYAQSGVALKTTRCQVYLDGKPLAGATITYVPEKFMGSSIRPAWGVSDAGGSAILSMDGEKLPGVQPGFYRVQVSKKNAKGEETIPARFNQDTVLGQEVSPQPKNRKIEKPEEEDGIYRLTSKAR